MRFSLRYFSLVVFILSMTLSVASGAQDMDIREDGKLVASRHFSDSLEASRFGEERVRELVFQGYPFARVDSVGDLQIWIHKGAQATLQVDSVSGPITFKTDRVPNPGKWVRKSLDELINNGYPFASFQICPRQVTDQALFATLIVDEGPKINWDTLQLVSPINTERNFLYSLLDITPGESYSEQTYRDIEKRISRASFLSLKAPPDISFGKGAARAYLDLEEIPVNSFEGIMGIQSTPGAAEPTVVTGFFDLDLENLFSSGKSFRFNWSRYGTQSQSLDLGFGYPFILGSKILIDFDFSLLKQDTTFVNREFTFTGSTFVGSKTLISGIYSRNIGSTISSDPPTDRSGLADFKTDWYSLEINSNKFETPFGFGSGFKAMGRLGVGRKAIVRNVNYPDSFYDTLLRVSASYELTAGLKAQQIVSKRTALYGSIRASGMWNPNLLQNELYRLGGLNSLRGFNENFYFLSRFVVSQIELRQYFESRSYFFTFYDQALTRNPNNYDIPYGFGGGFALNSNFGLFNFVLATGGSRTLSPDFTNTKIHFGYQAIF